MNDLHDTAHKLLALDARCNRYPDDGIAAEKFADSVPKMIGTIAGLLAENERLADELSAQVAATNGASAYAVQQANRAEAAEARLKALCEAEPVSWQDAANDDLRRSKMFSDDIALIPRPSMEVPRG